MTSRRVYPGGKNHNAVRRRNFVTLPDGVLHWVGSTVCRRQGVAGVFLGYGERVTV